MADYLPIKKVAPAAPMVPLAIAVIVGIVIAHYISLPKNFISIALIANLILIPILIFVFNSNPAPKRVRIIGFLICTSIALLAGLRYDLKFNNTPANHIARYVGDEQILATVKGQIISEPYLSEPKGPFKNFNFMQSASTIFTVKVTEIKTIDSWAKTSGNAIVAIDSITDINSDFKLGQTIQFDASLARRPGPTNFAQYNKTRQYRIADKLVAAHITHPESITIITQPTNSNFAKFRRKLQLWAQQSLIEEELSTSENSNNRAFLTALILGDRDNLTQTQYDNFIATGTIHFLAISGLHIGILTGFVWLVCTRIFRSNRNSSIATLIFLALFLIIIPPRAPVLRAAIIAATYLIANLFKRQSNTINTIAFSAIIILLLRPTDLFSRGFQLSYLIVLALYFFAGPLYLSLIIQPINSKQAEQIITRYSSHPWLYKFLYGLKSFFIATLTVSIIAAIVSIPLTAYHFNRISLTSVIASAILMPIITFILALGVTKIAITTIIPQLAFLIAVPLKHLSTFALYTVNSLASLPYCSINTKSPPLILLFIFYGLLIGIAIHYRIKERFSKILILCLTLWLIPFIYSLDNHNNSTQLHTLSIGDGLCTIIQMPNHTIIYDTGSLTNFNLTSQIVTPFIRSKGIGTIDALFISHSDLDHYSGIPELCQSFNIKKIYATEHLVNSNHKAAKTLIAELQKLDQTITIIDATAKFDFDDSYIHFLWPIDTAYSAPNNQSLVMHLKCNDTSILFTGDIEQMPQNILMQNHPEKIKTDIMIMPHHGSTVTLYPKFIDHCSPDLIINSMGNDRFGKIPKLKSLFPNQTILHTIEKGSITITIDDRAQTIETFK